jgi:PAS domain-containing protein
MPGFDGKGPSKVIYSLCQTRGIMKKKSPNMTKSSDWPHFIIQSMADGVITVDGEMHVTDLNRAAEKLTGYSRQKALGRFCGEVLQSSL